MSQLRVISCSRLLRIQQPPDQHFVVTRIPIGCTDDTFDDHAIPIDQIALGDAEDVVRLSDRAAGVVQNIERQAQRTGEGQYLLRPLLPVRHTVTMQRRRSSCTSRAGSALAKIALPATNVSAPA